MSFETSHARWQAVSSRLRAADGHFVYAVKSTKIYCRPTCPARLARRANVDFYRTATDAQGNGYRACKRCKPETAGLEEDGQGEIVQRACDVLAKWARTEAASEPESAAEGAAGENKMGLKELAAEVGKTPRYLHKIFKDRMGVTPKQYAEQISEMYRPTSTQVAMGTTAAIAEGSRAPIDSMSFDFAALDDFDFQLDPVYDMGQAYLGGGQTVSDDQSPSAMTDGTLSPGGHPSMPMTPNDAPFLDSLPVNLDQIVLQAQDLPPLSPSALDAILNDAMLDNRKLDDSTIDQRSSGELADWVWEAEWSNAVIDNYHRTAAVL